MHEVRSKWYNIRRDKGRLLKKKSRITVDTDLVCLIVCLVFCHCKPIFVPSYIDTYNRPAIVRTVLAGFLDDLYIFRRSRWLDVRTSLVLPQCTYGTFAYLPKLWELKRNMVKLKQERSSITIFEFQLIGTILHVTAWRESAWSA